MLESTACVCAHVHEAIACMSPDGGIPSVRVSDTALYVFVVHIFCLYGDRTSVCLRLLGQVGSERFVVDDVGAALSGSSRTVDGEGVYKKIPASKIVCGDVVKLEAGDQIPADIRLLTCRGLETNESALTGESLPVRKETKRISKGSPMAEWKNMVFMLTEVRKGSATGSSPGILWQEKEFVNILKIR